MLCKFKVRLINVVLGTYQEYSLKGLMGVTIDCEARLLAIMGKL